jgi:hypothetical protein
MTEKQAEYKAGLDLPEAPASLNVRGVTGKGWEVQFTLRDWSEEALLARFAEFVKKLDELHITPPGALRVAPPSLPVSAPAPEQLASAELPGFTGSPAPQKAEELSFDAVELVGEMHQGKTNWKVKGGKFTKFGVPIYPEALKESGIDPNGLDVSKVYPLKAMVAHYEEREGKAYKVTRLVYR